MASPNTGSMSPSNKLSASKLTTPRLIALIFGGLMNLYGALMTAFALIEVMDGPLFSLKAYFIMHVVFFVLVLIEAVFVIISAYSELKAVGDYRHMAVYVFSTVLFQSAVMAGYWVLYGRYELSDSPYGLQHSFKNFRKESQFKAFEETPGVVDLSATQVNHLVNLTRNNYAYTNWMVFQAFVAVSQLVKLLHFVHAAFTLNWPELTQGELMAGLSAGGADGVVTLASKRSDNRVAARM